VTEPQNSAATKVPEKENNDDLSKYGIIKTTVDVFHCGGYQYTNLVDAMAQAKRLPDATEPKNNPSTNYHK